MLQVVLSFPVVAVGSTHHDVHTKSATESAYVLRFSNPLINPDSIRAISSRFSFIVA